MGTNDYADSFSVCFNMMKMKYQTYDKDIDATRFINPNDNVNVFISFETVIKYLSQVKDIDRRLILEREYPVMLSSGAINLIAHYKRLFVQNGLPTRVFLYYTDLASDDYPEFEFNDEFRTYYHQKFRYNPKFSLLGDSLVDVIVPEVQTILQFVQGAYFIKAHNFEGSLIPMVVSNLSEYSSAKNLVISGDLYDTQYQCLDNYLMHYLKRNNCNATITYKVKESANMAFFDGEGRPDDLELLASNPSFYAIMLAAKGSKTRTIESLKGVGPKSIMKYLNASINSGAINKETTNLDMIINTLPEDVQERLMINSKCTSLEEQYKRLTTEDIFSVESQVVDRFDNNSLVRLNADRYYHHQLMLEELTMTTPH